ncbi:hypothetical protein AB0F85_07210 [Nocardia fluminea]|uniref:hypothetical protein n=1 Tax=Nocardia fluminea TaxID=134984 RepID=UPI0033E6E9A5
MSYHMRIWEGKRPSSAAHPDEVLLRMGDLADGRYLRGEDPDPPNPKIAEFIAALLRRWPDIEEEGSPWSSSGTGYADGPTLTVHIQWGREEEVSEFVAGLAMVYGLVCYDCQPGRGLRP